MCCSRGGRRGSRPYYCVRKKKDCVIFFGARVKNPFLLRLGFLQLPGRRPALALRLALALLRMGKKSRRPARQQKRLTLDDLDDDTAKPIPPLGVAEIHAKWYQERYTGQLDSVEYTKDLDAAWRSLSDGDILTYERALSNRRNAVRCFELSSRCGGVF